MTTNNTKSRLFDALLDSPFGKISSRNEASDISAEVDEGTLRALIEQITALPEGLWMPRTLTIVSQILERAAYDLAASSRPDHVALLIRTAAELDRLAQDIHTV